MSSGRRRWLITAAVATAVFVFTALAARDRSVSGFEGDMFRFFNEGPGWLYGLLWPVMQFGNVLVASATAVLVGAALRRWRVAVGGVVACMAAWLVAKLVKSTIERGRPAALLESVRFLGVLEDGFGFISGHSAVAFALASVVTAALPRRWRAVPFAIATVVAVARLYVGVHLPLDVIGGAAIGIAIGGLVNAVIDAPAPVRLAGQSVATSPTGHATPVPPRPQ